MRILYDAGILLMDAGLHAAAPFNAKARLWVKGRRNIFREMAAAAEPGADVIWFHAASLGEFEQGRPVIEAFRAARPEYKILVTFFSPSGYEIRKNYAGADYIFYLPLDTPRNVRRFLDIFRPKIAVFVKYEFWLNYLLEMERRGTKIYLISSIFRPRQIFFRPWGGLFRRALRGFGHLFVQNEESRQLLAGIGIDRVSVAGDTRFDRVHSIASQAKELPEVARFAAGAPVLVAGSTWPPDEELLTGLIARYGDVKFIVAPHEIDSARIERLIARIGRPALRYTQLTPQSDLERAQVLFIDTIGILSSVYRYGRWGYIGGGFGVGIHNTLEAATFGLPLAFGPRYEKFPEARDLIALGGAASVSGEQELQQWFAALHDDPDRTRRCAEACRDYVAEHKGATDQIMAEICR